MAQDRNIWKGFRARRFVEMFRDPDQLARWKVIQRARENFTEDIDTCNRENWRYIEGATRDTVERERER